MNEVDIQPVDLGDELGMRVQLRLALPPVVIVRSRHEDAMPLIVTHGWPGSPIEQLKIIRLGLLDCWGERVGLGLEKTVGMAKVGIERWRKDGGFSRP